jgi:ferric-dicitrate binding protein FerR (iron transport regulator)
MWMAAAGLAIAALGVVATRSPFGSSRTVGAETPYAIYTTQPGQRASVELSDGTRVLLNVASTLEVSRNFGSQNRVVRLRGEAVFTVNHANAQPFVVDAVGTRSTVLGTSFAVRAYDANVRVAVQSGKVAVTPCNAVGADVPCAQDNGHVVLGAHDVASVASSGRIRAQRNVDVDDAFAFTAGRLVLPPLPLGDVVGDLDRWYDIDVRLADDAVAHKVLEGSFPAGTLDALIQSLTTVLNIHVQRNGRVITLSSSSASTSTLTAP